MKGMLIAVLAAGLLMGCRDGGDTTDNSQTDQSQTINNDVGIMAPTNAADVAELPPGLIVVQDGTGNLLVYDVEVGEIMPGWTVLRQGGSNNVAVISYKRPPEVVEADPSAPAE